MNLYIFKCDFFSFTHRVSTGGNAIASVRPFVRPSISTVTFKLSDFDLDLLHVYES